MIAFVTDRLTGRNGQQPAALGDREPVPEAHSQAFRSPDPADPRRQIRIEKAVVGGLERQSTDRGKSQVDRCRRKPARLQLVPVPENNSPAKRKSGL